MRNEQENTNLSALSVKFIKTNDNNEDESFKKWKWDAIINAIEIGEIDEKYLIENNYI